MKMDMGVEVCFQLHAPTTYAYGENSLYPLDRRLGRPQSRSRYVGENKNPWFCPESNPGQARNLVTILTELFRLRLEQLKVKVKVKSSLCSTKHHAMKA
jgi:hypothetical protein